MQQDNTRSSGPPYEETEQRLSPSTEPESGSVDQKNKPGAKPRASRAGTRSVSTLNAEQLARKRANDREAQRAIRQRTREHIERLENRIKELSENSPETDAALEAVQRRNAELEEELRQLRKTLFGMAEGSNSPSGSHQHPTFGRSPNSQIGSTSYTTQSSWAAQNPQIGFSQLPPTSNPMPEADPSWQPQIPITHPRRTLHQQTHAGYQQAISWSRHESNDSDYDSGFANEPDHMGNPVGVYPEQMRTYMMQNPHPPIQGALWQTPASSSGMSTPYEAHRQLPNMSTLPIIPTSTGDDPRVHSMKQPHLGHHGMTGGWGPPSPHGSVF